MIGEFYGISGRQENFNLKCIPFPLTVHLRRDFSKGIVQRLRSGASFRRVLFHRRVGTKTTKSRVNTDGKLFDKRAADVACVQLSSRSNVEQSNGVSKYWEILSPKDSGSPIVQSSASYRRVTSVVVVSEDEHHCRILSKLSFDESSEQGVAV